MAISTFDLFKIGIGPSSSHTVGPMRAAEAFSQELITDHTLLSQLDRIQVELFGSLGATGKGHGTPKAIILGLLGYLPESVDVEIIPNLIADIRSKNSLNIANKRTIKFDERHDIILYKNRLLPKHTNGMKFKAFDNNEKLLAERIYYSVGGGFILNENTITDNVIVEDNTLLPYPFDTCAELLLHCKEHRLSISSVMLKNELTWRSLQTINQELLTLWQVMQDSVNNGIIHGGTLPGGLKVKRRAPELHRQLTENNDSSLADPLIITDWVTLYALAVNEENAAGGRIVTAPTNGAAGIIPAVLHYFYHFCPQANERAIQKFLLTAAAIGILYKKNASISGAEVGCQGEVGSACSMAAGALTEVLGGTVDQVENAAEIAMEHNLGLTCDPIGGLVQIPCIERNAMAAIKAISASRMALRGDGTHFVSLDKVIKTMRDTGKDMHSKYKETARGGLALNVIEVPVNIVDC